MVKLALKRRPETLEWGANSIITIPNVSHAVMAKIVSILTWPTTVAALLFPWGAPTLLSWKGTWRSMAFIFSSAYTRSSFFALYVFSSLLILEHGKNWRVFFSYFSRRRYTRTTSFVGLYTEAAKPTEG